MENKKDIDESVGVYVEGKGKNIICEGDIEGEFIWRTGNKKTNIFELNEKENIGELLLGLIDVVKKQNQRIEELERIIN